MSAEVQREEVQQFCSFRVGELMFGVRVMEVQEILRFQEITPVPLAHPVIEGLINLRGQIITAIDLRRRLGLPERCTEKPPMNVVVRTGDGIVSLLVDEIGDVLELTGKHREEPPESLTGDLRTVVHGVYKLSQGLLLELSVQQALVSPAESRDTAAH